MRVARLRCVLCMAFLSLTSMGTSADMDCDDANLMSGALMTNICWDCIFPIKVAGATLGGSGDIPDGAADKEFYCICDGDDGLAIVGLPMGFWEPARLIEFQTTPGCSSVLGGIKFPMDKLFRGTIGNLSETADSSMGSFYHYHYYAFPLLMMMEMFTNKGCNADGYMDLDLMYLSELDPSWNNSELAFFLNPEAALVSNPVATVACAADAAAAMAGDTLNDMFWCAGTWGTIYPLSGHNSQSSGILQDTSLNKIKTIAALHRRGLAWRTMGNDAMCRGVIDPTFDKEMYKYTIVHANPETQSAHVTGAPVMQWGANRLIPGTADMPIYMSWRWVDCCLR